MYINEISKIVGTRPIYNDKRSSQRGVELRCRSWAVVDPCEALQVMQRLMALQAYKNPGFRIEYHADTFQDGSQRGRLKVTMPDVKTKG